MMTQDLNSFKRNCKVRLFQNSRSFLPKGVEIGGIYIFQSIAEVGGVKIAHLEVQKDGRVSYVNVPAQDIELHKPISKAPGKPVSIERPHAPETITVEAW